MAFWPCKPIGAGPGARERTERLPEHVRLARSAQRSLRWMSVSSRDVTRKRRALESEGRQGSIVAQSERIRALRLASSAGKQHAQARNARAHSCLPPSHCLRVSTPSRRTVSTGVSTVDGGGVSACKHLLDEVAKVVVGQRPLIEGLLVGLLCGGGLAEGESESGLVLYVAQRSQRTQR